MKIKIIAFALLVTTLFGCTDILDVTPSSDWKLEQFYTNKLEVEMALSGIYRKLANDNLYGLNLILLELGTDESYSNDGALGWSDSRYEIMPADGPILNAWAQLYSCIQAVNQLEKNMKPENFKVQKYNEYLAKARFYRAFCYFTLANWWGPVPLRLTPSTQQTDNNIAASSAYDVYKQAEKDFLFAAQYLKHANDPDYKAGEPNKMAAHGLLARLYLRMGGYQPYLSANEAECFFPDNSQYFTKAMEHCDTIIYQDSWHGIVPFAQDSLSYRTHFLSYLQDKYDTKESLFEISFGYLQNLGISVSGRLGVTNGVLFSGVTNIPRGFGKIMASVALYDLYMQNPTDKRLNWNIAGYKNYFNSSTQTFTMYYIMNTPFDAAYSPGKYRRWEPKDITALKNAPSSRINGAEYTILNNTASATDPNLTSTNFPILRYADVLLMYAEAAIGGRTGTTEPSQKAVDCLNRVRKRAGLTDFTNTNHDAFFNELVDERMRELCFEGLRKQDLIRWNLLGDKLAHLANSIKLNAAYIPNNAGQKIFLAASVNFNKDKNLLLPYPQQEVEINASLEQKANW
jgi:hypothetical protein